MRTTLGIQAWSALKASYSFSGCLVVGGVAAVPGAVGAGDVLVFEADVLVADEAFASAAGCAVAVLVRPGRMEAHPDGEIFFAQDIDGEEDAAKVFAEILGPVLADVVELAGERVGRGEQGRAKRVEQGSGFRRERRAGDEVVGKRRR